MSESPPPNPSPDPKLPVPAPPNAAQEVPQFVTNLAPIEHQVGTHVIAALQHPATVAVMTTVAQGPDGHQRVVSVGLKPEVVAEVQRILNDAEASRTKRVPCVGFHCWVEDRDGDGIPDREQSGDAGATPGEETTE